MLILNDLPLTHNKVFLRKKKDVSRLHDDDSSDSRPSFTDAVKPPPAPRTDTFNNVNPLLDEGLAQNPRALSKISRSSQGNLAAFAGNTAEPSDMPVPPAL